MREEIRYFISDAGNEPFIIDMCGISYCDGTYRIERESSEVTVMEYVLAGTGTIQIDQKVYTASAGDVYLLPQGAYHLYYSDSDDPWTKLFFNVKGDLVENVLRSYKLYGKHLFFCPQAENIFTEFYQNACKNLPKEVLFEKGALLFHKLASLLYHTDDQSENIPEDALRLKRYLDEHLSRKISIEELSKTINRSPNYTIKLFKEVYRQTPYAYLLQQKMEVAKNLLSNTSFSVKEIASQLGYEDQHYFSNLFKEICGCAPKFYKKNYTPK